MLELRIQGFRWRLSQIGVQGLGLPLNPKPDRYPGWENWVSEQWCSFLDACMGFIISEIEFSKDSQKLQASSRTGVRVEGFAFLTAEL